MKIAICYPPRGGNTKEAAETIAKTAGVTAESVRTFLIGIFWILLTSGLAADLPAEEIHSAAVSGRPFLLNDTVMNIESALSTAPDEWVFENFSAGRRVGAGFMNMFLGLGSYTMGDWRGGLTMTLTDIVVIPLSALCIYNIVNEPWLQSFPEYFSSGNITLDMVLLMPLWYGLFVAVWCSHYAIAVSYPFTWVYKFRRPFVYMKPARTARLDDLRNWNFGLAPDGKGGMNGLAAFTAHF